MKRVQQVFVTGVERSGATIIAKILALCGVYTGEVNAMGENTSVKVLVDDLYRQMGADVSGQYPLPDLDLLNTPDEWIKEVESRIFDGRTPDKIWLYKSSRILQTWPVWLLTFPNAKWIFVRRKPSDIINSCKLTMYMKAFKNPEILSKIGVSTEEEGWLWWIRQQDDLLKSLLHNLNIDYKVIWPERMVNGDFSQIYEMLDWLEVPWNNKIIPTVKPLLWKGKNLKILVK